jgi:ankyrin repeat protein
MARGEEGLAALHVAAKKGNVAGVRILLKYGADSGLKDDAGSAPLEMTRNKQVASLLAKRS